MVGWGPGPRMLQVGMETNPVSLEAVWQYILEAFIITTFIIISLYNNKGK